MDSKVTITEEPEDPGLTRRMTQYRHNGEWLTAHGAPLFERYRDKYIAV
jgi:hypothetical protein